MTARTKKAEEATSGTSAPAPVRQRLEDPAGTMTEEDLSEEDRALVREVAARSVVGDKDLWPSGSRMVFEVTEAFVADLNNTVTREIAHQKASAAASEAARSYRLAEARERVRARYAMLLPKGERIMPSPPLDEFDPDAGELFETVGDSGPPELGIAFVRPGRIYRTTFSNEIERIRNDTAGDPRDMARAEAKFRASLPFTNLRDAAWPLPSDPTSESVAEWEARNGTILARLVAYFGERVVVAHEEDLVVLGLWALAAAARAPHIDFAPRLMFEGPFGWGKSSQAEAVGLVVVRTIYGAVVTSAAVYRVLNEYHPTLIIDESAVADNKELLSVLRAGFKRGPRVIRAAQKADRGIVLVDPFGFLILTTQVDTRDDLLSRCFLIVLVPGNPAKRASSRDPETKILRTVLGRLRLEVLAGTLYPNLAEVAESARAQPGAEPRSHDKLVALWPWAVRYGATRELLAAASRLEADATEQLKAGDKGLVASAIADVVRDAGGLDRVRALDLTLAAIHGRVETRLIEQGEGTKIPTSSGEVVIRLDARRYSPRDYTAPLIRALGIKTKTADGRSRLDLKQFLQVWPQIFARYGGTTTLDDSAAEGGQHTPTTPTLRGELSSEGRPVQDPYTIPTPPLHPPSRSVGGVGISGGDARPPAPSLPTPLQEKPSGGERVDRAVSVLRAYLGERSGGSEFDRARQHLVVVGFTPVEADRALGRLSGSGEVELLGDLLRLKEHGGPR